MEGDFDRATAILDRAIREKRLGSHADSVFAFKHLGVMLAASEDTREKGKYFMLQLLHVEPTAKILDMYASDMIYLIFRNLKEEFEESRARLQRAEAHLQGNRQALATGADPATARPRADTLPTDRAGPPSSQGRPVAKAAFRKPDRRLWYLVGAAVAAAGVGFAAYLAEDGAESKRVTYVVD